MILLMSGTNFIDMARHQFTDYPVGTTFVAEGYGGKEWCVRLIARHDHFEHWSYAEYYSDGSGYRGDWYPGLRGAKARCNNKKRFKRVYDRDTKN